MLNGMTNNQEEHSKSLTAVVSIMLISGFCLCKRMDEAPFRYRGDPRLLLLDCMKKHGWHLKGSSKLKRAGDLAQGILQLVDGSHQIVDKTTEKLRPIHYGDIAILCRTNDGLKELAGACAAASCSKPAEGANNERRTLRVRVGCVSRCIRICSASADRPD